jgi:DNA replication licensing factor MCM6
MEDDRQPQDPQPELASTADLGAELRDKFLDFLEAFTEADAAKASNAPVPEGGEAELFYVNQVHAMRTDEKSTLFVDFCHVDLHDWELARTIETEFLRVETYLRKVLVLCTRLCMLYTPSGV